MEKLRLDTEATRMPGAASRVVGKMQVFVHDVIDDAAERARLEKDLARVDKEIGACEKKLGNEHFVSKAPGAVVAEQKQRLADYQASREAILSNMKELEG